MSLDKLVSIIIRTKDEERWISQCLRAVFSQNYKNFEVIIVDNESSDKTIEKAQTFKIAEVITCTDYRPGKALNAGIRKSNGDYIVCLSGHCIPVNSNWLGNLLRNFDDPNVAGVYGRQEPMSFTSDADKRDLALVFGLDKRSQSKDTFFHNANSMIRMDKWVETPFDEMVTNIEDRVWAKRVLSMGQKIVYEPEASVYHYHGIHQNGDVERCANVVRILESMHPGYGYKAIEINNLNIVALIPVRGSIEYLNDKPLLAYTIDRVRESKYVKKVVVSTDNKELASLAVNLGAEVPFIRDLDFSKEHVNLAQVLKYSLSKMEEAKIFPDIVISLEITFPFRPKGLLDEMIIQLAQNGFDSVVAARRENRAIWKERDEEIVQLDEGLMPRQLKDPTFIELRGVGCVTHPEFLRNGQLLGRKIGIYEVNNPYSHIEVRSHDELKMVSPLVHQWFNV